MCTHSITYKHESLCCTPETMLILCVNYIQIEKLTKQNTPKVPPFTDCRQNILEDINSLVNSNL